MTQRPVRVPHLRHAIGVVALSTEIINMTVGAGIFALPGVAAEHLGPQAWVAYVVCALAMASALFCFAVAGSRVTTSGGPYVYVQAAFGAFPAFLSGVLLWVGAVVSSAAVATVFAAMLGTVLPAAATPLGRAVALALIYGIAVVVNARGVRAGASAVTGFAMAKLLPLVVLVIVVGVMYLLGHLEPITTAAADVGAAAGEGLSPTTVGRAALVLIFAFFGAEVALAPSGEMERPSHTVPLAIGIALAVVTVLYLALQATAQGVLGPALAQDPAVRAAPLAAVGTKLFGPIGAAVLTAAALVSTAGYVIGDVLASPRVLYALATDGHLPRVLARLHVQHETPAVAIVLHGVVAALLAISGTFATLVILNNVAILVLYLVCCVAAFVLLRQDAAEEGQGRRDKHFTPPFGPLIPMVACGVILWLLAQAQWKEFAAVAVALGLATLAYLFKRRTAAREVMGLEEES